ncbi:hypothetical protein QLX08_009431 [Tetragonisca angustula]|uniref:Ribosome-binding factor A n=1 Tax=Tetragonisca angustula TaxID=166442 RepID=A0AAW0ZHC9_9HYME
MQNMGIKQIFRCICTNSIKYNISKQSKIINKFIEKNKRNRESIENIYPHSLKNKLSVYTIRRMNVLNKVFMEYITDLMSTGEISTEILDRNIEITHVRITADFKFINVYWVDNNTEKSNTEELLNQCAFSLRHKLSQLRVVGMVPPVQFVKCKGISVLREVEEKLKTLEFDKDHVSSPYPDAIHHTVSASKICENNEDVQNGEDDNFKVIVPVMKHDVFGLDHFKIMSKIKFSLNKFKKSEQQTLSIPILNTFSTLDVKDKFNFLTNKEQQEEFKQFLNQRQKEQRKKMRKRFNVDDIVDDDDDDEEQNDDNDFGKNHEFTEDDCNDFYNCNDDIDEEFNKK